MSRFTLKDMYGATHVPRPMFNFLLNPVICRVAWFFVNFTNFSPNFVTLLSFIFVIGSAFFFFKGLFLFGSLCYLARYILDYVDGKIARLKKKSSKFGAYFDNGTGYVGTALCAIALVYSMDKTILLFLIPLIVMMSVIHPLQTVIVMLFLKKTRKKEYQEFLGFEDSRTMTFVLVPLIPYFIQVQDIMLLPVLTLTVLLFFVKQFSWFTYYYKEFFDYMKEKNKL